MKTGEKIQLVLVKTFYSGALAMFAWFFLAGILSVKGNTAELLIFGIITLALVTGVFLLIRRLGPQRTDKLFWKILICTIAGMAILQLAVAAFLAVMPSWDFGGVLLSAHDYVTHGRVITHEHYFERFPNNTGLLLWEIVCFKVLSLLGISSPVLYGVAGIMMNILVIDASILFAVLFCRRVWGSERALQFLALSALFTPYILYSPIFYTDTMSMLFVTLPLYLFSLYQDQKNKWIRLAQAVSIGLLLSFGTKVKGSVAVLLVALIIYSLFNFNIKRMLSLILAMVIPFAGFSVLLDSQIRNMGIIRDDRAHLFQFPTEYWFYMGLKSPGGFNSEDFEYLYAMEDVEARRQAAREGIAERLSDYGVSGLVEHITKKAEYTFNDGTYFIGVQLMREPLRTTALSRFFHADSPDYAHYKAAADVYHCLILLLILICLAWKLFTCRKFDFTTLLLVTLFGLFLFLMMWETRSRYLMNFTPLMLILAAEALPQTGALIQKLRNRVRSVYVSHKNSTITKEEGGEIL